MIKRLTSSSLLASVLFAWLMAPQPGAAQPQTQGGVYPYPDQRLVLPPPSPFAKGNSMGGILFGLSSYNGSTMVTAGLSYGYFVIDGLAIGLASRVDVPSAGPNRLELSPYVRFIPITFQNISPVFIAKGGRMFIQDQDDLWNLGGGGGLIFMTSSRVGFNAEVIYERFFPENVCTPVCSRVLFSGGIGVFF